MRIRAAPWFTPSSEALPQAEPPQGNKYEQLAVRRPEISEGRYDAGSDVSVDIAKVDVEVVFHGRPRERLVDQPLTTAAGPSMVERLVSCDAV